MRSGNISRGMIWTLGLCACTLVLSFASPLPSAQPADECQASSAVRAELDHLPAEPAARLAGVRALLRSHPNDLHVQQAYINASLNLYKAHEVAAQYKARHEHDPENAQLDYLYGLTLVGTRTPEAIRLFGAALKKAPSFPWPHLSLGEIYTAPAFLDEQKAAANVEAFVDACPSVLAGYNLLSRIANPAIAREAAPRLRNVLANRSDPAAVAAYQVLWSLEFKAYPRSEYGQVRDRVARDLARIRTLNLKDQREWYLTLMTGYKLADDPKGAKWAIEQFQSRFPSSETPEMARWFNAHRRPNPDASPGAMHEYYRDLLEQTSGWASKRPMEPLRELGEWNRYVAIQIYRVEAMEHLSGIPAPEVDAAVRQMLNVARESGGPYPGEGVCSLAAELLSKRRIDPELLVRIARKRLAILELQSKTPPSDLYVTSGNVADNEFRNSQTRTKFLKFEAEGYLGLKEAARAQLVLDRLDDSLRVQKRIAGGRQDWRQAYLSEESAYWTLKARLAELQGHKQDAMAFYEVALLTRLRAKQKIDGDERDRLSDQAHELWTSLGGTAAAWSAWYGRRASGFGSVDTLAWEKSDQRLPPFKLTDLNGKTWTPEDVRGKVTILTFWATWCGPCREELPQLQELINRYEGRAGVQFLTLSVDDDPGLIGPFMQKHRFTFVVLPAFDYARNTLKIFTIPETWILDARGVVRLKGIGYDASNQWQKSMADAIQAYEPPSAAVAAAPASHN